MKREWKDPLLKRALGIGLIAVLCVCLIMVFWRMLDDSGNLLTLLGGFFSLLWSALSPFVGAAVLAYILLPLVRFLRDKPLKLLFRSEKSHRLRHALAVILTMLALLASLSLLLYNLIPLLIRNVQDLVSNLDGYLKTAQAYVQRLLNENPFLTQPVIARALESAIGRLDARADTLAASAVPWAIDTVKSVTSTVSGVLIALIGCVYLLFDGDHMKAGLKRFWLVHFGEKRAARAFDLAHVLDTVFGGYVKARLLESLAVFILTLIAFLIAGAPYTVLFAVLGAVTNLVPYFGPIVGWILTVGLLLLIDPILALFAAIFILVMQQLDGNVLGPKLMGDSLHLRPFTIILAVTVGGTLFGVPGMLLGVPVTAVAAELLKRFTDRREAAKAQIKQGKTPPAPKEDKGEEQDV